MERRLASIAKQYGIRVIGPNSLGVINTHHHMNATFTNNFPRAGPIAISSQSGAICSVLLDWAAGTNIGFSKFVSVGNKVDIEESYMLDFLRHDDRTKVIGMYIEGVNKGKEFMEQAAETTKVKPIIALKAGRTSTGAKAASSHTGALSGSDMVYDTVLRQSGIIRVTTIEEMFDLLAIFANMPMPKDNRVAIVTNAGGLGVMAADALGDHNLTLASFSAETVERLKANLPAAAAFYNPVDVVGDADAERYEYAIRAIAEDENVSSVIALMAPTDLVDVASVARTISSFAGKVEKPIVTSFVGGEDLKEAISILRASGIPNYDTPDQAAFSIGAMLRYQAHNQRKPSVEVFRAEADLSLVREVLQEVREQGRLQLSEGEGKRILRAYGLNVPEEGLAHSPDEAVAIARRIGYPVVMKVESPDIAHKTDVGGVAVDIKSDEEVAQQYQLIISRSRGKMPNARVDGVSVQKMLKGREVIVGMVRDEQFGPVVTFGLGGIFVEIMKDVAQLVAPFGRAEAAQLVRSIKAYPILTGARGRRPADIKALEDTILTLAQIAMDFPEISELEVNPVIVGDEGQGVGAVDALVTIRRDKE
jgi:acetyltransferase